MIWLPQLASLCVVCSLASPFVVLASPFVVCGLGFVVCREGMCNSGRERISPKYKRHRPPNARSASNAGGIKRAKRTKKIFLLLVLNFCKFSGVICQGIYDKFFVPVKDENLTDLIHLIRSGDEKAFETVYRLYANNLYIVAMSYVQDDFIAEEIVQKVFIRLWDKRKELDIRTSVNGYLFIMVKNKCLDYLRKPRKVIPIDGHEEQKERDIHFFALQDDGASRLIESELEKKIHEGIELLPDACKAVFMKTKMEGLKYAEAAKELNISVKTVESHMSKALRHMRLYLREFLSVFF